MSYATTPQPVVPSWARHDPKALAAVLAELRLPGARSATAIRKLRSQRMKNKPAPVLAHVSVMSPLEQRRARLLNQLISLLAGRVTPVSVRIVMKEIIVHRFHH